MFCQYSTAGGTFLEEKSRGAVKRDLLSTDNTFEETVKTHNEDEGCYLFCFTMYYTRM